MLQVAIDDLRAVVDAVLTATFGLTAVEGPAPVDVPMISSLVGIAGSWNGAVLVGCTLPLARRLASSMFGVPDAELTQDHLEDTMGEMANMVGGNVKAIIPPSNSLSLPTVVEGRDYRVRVPQTSVVHDLVSHVDGEAIRVTVLERASRTW